MCRLLAPMWLLLFQVGETVHTDIGRKQQMIFIHTNSLYPVCQTTPKVNGLISKPRRILHPIPVEIRSAGSCVILPRNFTSHTHGSPSPLLPECKSSAKVTVEFGFAQSYGSSATADVKVVLVTWPSKPSLPQSASPVTLFISNYIKPSPLLPM